MKTGKAGISLIKGYEKLRLMSYPCEAGIWTVGYGHTATAGPGQKISEARAEGLLEADLYNAESAVNKVPAGTLNQNQFDALVSLVFNIGVAAFRASTLLKCLTRGIPNYPGAAEQFAAWNKARVKGVLQVLNGLTARRAAERKLFETP